MKGVARVGMAGMAGAMLAMVYPDWNWAGLVWVWLLPLLWVLWTVGGEGKRGGWKGMGLGWVAGMVFFGVNLSWLWTVSVAGALVLAVFLGLYFGAWGGYAATWGNPWRQRAEAVGEGLAGRVARKMAERGGAGGKWSAAWRETSRSVRFGFGNAAWWCGLEWARGYLFTGFSWNGLGVAFHEVPVLAQAADLFGVTGLAFLPVFAQVVAMQTLRRLMDQARGGAKVRAHWDFGFAVVLMLGVFVYGAWRLSSTGRGESVRLKALLVQVNVPQVAAERLWSPEQVHMAYEEETLGALRALEDANARRLEEKVRQDETGQVEVDWPQWIVWPENSLSGRVLRSPDKGWGMWRENWETIQRVREAGEFTFVLGLNELEAEAAGDQLVMKEDGKIWNSLVVLPPDDKLVSFAKHHLVMFGEYIPLVEQLPFLRAIYEQQAGIEYQGAFSRGESLEPLTVKVDGVETGIVPSVCFEDTVPRLMRKFVRPGPQLLVNVTNDGWFLTNSAAAQHFANARFRAIELRRPMIRCANTGVSAVVMANGTTILPQTGRKQELRNAEGSHFTRGWLLGVVDIPLRPPWTLYAVAGDWPVILLGVAGLLGGWRRSR